MSRKQYKGRRQSRKGSKKHLLNSNRWDSKNLKHYLFQWSKEMREWSKEVREWFTEIRKWKVLILTIIVMSGNLPTRSNIAMTQIESLLNYLKLFVEIFVDRLGRH